MKFLTVLAVFLLSIFKWMDANGSTNTEPPGNSENTGFVVKYLLTKADSLQEELHALRLAVTEKFHGLRIGDLNADLLALREEIKTLKSSHIVELQAVTANYSKEIQQLNSRHNNEIQHLNAEIHKLSLGQASTYVRWGRTVCRGNGTVTVYSGHTSGSPYDLDGGAASYICLPKEPEWASYRDGIQNYGGYVSGTEYEIYSDFNPFSKALHNHDAPCVVCRAPRPTTIIIPGRRVCYDGWTTEYSGYLMTGHTTQKGGTDYVCVDVDAEIVHGGENDQNGKLLYLAEVKCGSLPCLEYPDGRELACVVCSK